MDYYKKPQSKTRYYVNGREVTDPKGKAKVCLSFVFVLSFFAIVFIAVLAFLTTEALNPGDFIYSYEEESHVNNVIYNITVVDKTEENGTANRFNVVIDASSYFATKNRTVTNFNAETSEGKTTYTFTIQITGEDWKYAEGIANIEMVTDLGTFEPEYNSGIDMLWLAYLVVGVFLAIIITLIVFNAKGAAKHFKEAREELNGKIKATQTAVMNNKTISESTTNEKVEIPQVPSSEKELISQQNIKCPYCGSLNGETASRCKTCNAPLR